MRKILFLLVAAFLLSACAPSPAVIQSAIAKTQAAWTAVPTQTPQPTYTKLPTSIIVVYVTRVVTPIPTPTPPGPPTKTPNTVATATAEFLAFLRSDKEDGNYLVGVDIAPGVWRNSGRGDDCYWATTTRTSDIIRNYLGLGRGTAYIGPGDFAFRSDNCGVWTFLSPP